MKIKDKVIPISRFGKTPIREANWDNANRKGVFFLWVGWIDNANHRMNLCDSPRTGSGMGCPYDFTDVVPWSENEEAYQKSIHVGELEDK